MDPQTSLLLLAAGIAGGIINALAGGATLITFPAMLAAGLPAVIANASNAVAISPGHLIAALADRGKVRHRRGACSASSSSPPSAAQSEPACCCCFPNGCSSCRCRA